MNEHKEPKVLVGAPTAAPYAYCLAAWASRVKELTYKNYTALLVDNSETIPYHETIEQQGIPAVKYPEFIKDSRARLPASRNLLRKKVLEEGYDYFLSLEQDVIPPVDVIEKLIRHQKPIVSGVYYKPYALTYYHQGKVVKSVKKVTPLLFGLIEGVQTRMQFLSAEDVEEEKLIAIRFCGLGCVLIHRSVLEKIQFRSDKSIDCHDDLWFCNDAIEHKFPIVADTSVKCQHVISGKPAGLFADVQKGFNPLAFQQKKP